MTVLHLAAGKVYGGIEACLAAVARFGTGHAFAVCFPGRLRDELLAAGAAVHDVGAVRFARPWTLLRARGRLAAVLAGGRYAGVVAHGCWPHAAFAPVVRRAGVRLVHAAHGELAGRHWLDRWAARTPPDAVVANSRFTAGTVAAAFPGVPVEVVYPPVPPPDMPDPAAVRRAVRAELGTPADAVVGLTACRVEALKGHRVLVASLAQLGDVPGWAWWVAGGATGADAERLLSDVTAAAAAAGVDDRVRFLGPRADVPRLLAAADLVCQPNTGPEGFGVAFVEALHAGRPVVTSGFGGAVEVVDDTCGILTEPGYGGQVAGAVRELLTDPARRRALGVAGPGRAAMLCDPARQAARLRAVAGG